MKLAFVLVAFLFNIAPAQEAVTAPQKPLYHVGGGVSEPKLLYEAPVDGKGLKAIPPVHIEVYLVVEADGTTSNVRLAKMTGTQWDIRALEAVRKYRFKPSMKKNGEPVRVDMYLGVLVGF